MKRSSIVTVMMFLYLGCSIALFGQEVTKSAQQVERQNGSSGQDAAKQIKGSPAKVSAGVESIYLDREASLALLQKIYSSSGIWKKTHDPLREAIGELIHLASRPPVDTLNLFLAGYPFTKIRIPMEKYYLYDSIRIILPVMPVDTARYDTVPRAEKEGEMFIKAGEKLEKVRLTGDSKPIMRNDTLAINDSVYILMKEFVPAVLPQLSHDTIILVITDTLPDPARQEKDFPFRHLKQHYMADSIEVAIKSLLHYLEDRDSTMIKLESSEGRGTNIWLNGKTNNLSRFWLPDGKGDSVTVWIGAPERNTLMLNAEEGVLFKKQLWHDKYVDTKVNVTTVVDEALREVTLSKIKPVYWKFKGDMSYLLSQGIVENWAKGGESNISSVLDVTGYLNYNNKTTGVTSATSARFALGFMISGWNFKDDLKKNLDLIEINSKVNHKAFGKFDLSGIFQFKTQTLPGYNYPNDSVKVSKFFNPATLILGYGLDYKPKKNLSISCSPISYKGIFVPDTANINQTKYGVAADKRSKNEMGAYVTINHTGKVFDKVSVTNKVQFFSNFLSNPENVDIDWEIIATTTLNWFTEIRLNAHMIYDDNTLIPQVDKDKQPILGPDGKQIKVPKLQFKELLGLSFVVKF